MIKSYFDALQVYKGIAQALNWTVLYTLNIVVGRVPHWFVFCTCTNVTIPWTSLRVEVHMADLSTSHFCNKLEVLDWVLHEDGFIQYTKKYLMKSHLILFSIYNIVVYNYCR